MSTDEVLERIAARVLLVAPDRATLLVLGQDPSDLDRGSFYWTPGGGLDDGECAEDGACREVFEEVGYRIAPNDLGPVVFERVGEFPFAGRQVRQTESFFMVDVPERFACAPHELSSLEQAAILDFRWLTPSEMRLSTSAVYPECLADLIDDRFDRDSS